VINAEALAYSRRPFTSASANRLLANADDKQCARQASLQAHPDRLASARLKVAPDPTQIATERAWAASRRNGLPWRHSDVSDDAGHSSGQARIHLGSTQNGLVHKNSTPFTAQHLPSPKQQQRKLIWRTTTPSSVLPGSPNPKRPLSRAPLRQIFPRAPACHSRQRARIA